MMAQQLQPYLISLPIHTRCLLQLLRTMYIIVIHMLYQVQMFQKFRQETLIFLQCLA